MIWQYIMAVKSVVQLRNWPASQPARVQRVKLERRWLITRRSTIDLSS
ncbi:hypothetical protein [Clostridium sp. Marseille-P299]|nr:hypothetical protein [Clostridium sp. Marseille-P299]